MRRLHVPRYIGGAGGVAPTDTDASSWQSAVITNGGTVSPSRLALVSQFITLEKSAGTWALTDDYWALWGENAPQALTSLKQRRLATATAAPVFTADRGYQFDGVANFIATGFVPSTHKVVMAGTNLRIAVYERTNVSSAVSAGATHTGVGGHWIAARSSNVMFGRNNNSSNISYTLPVADSRGYSSTSRNGTTIADHKAWKNGVELVNAGGAVVLTSTLISHGYYIGANNNTGVAQFFSANSVGFVCVGAALTTAQELAQYNNVDAFANAVGASVNNDADAVAWSAQVVANGGTVSAARFKIVENFIIAEKADGTWALTDDYWPLWGENAVQSLTSLKQRRLATATAAPTFTADRGYLFNGTTQYLDTGYVPSTHSLALTMNSARIAVYCRNNVTGSYAIGVGIGTNNIISIRPRSSATIMFAGANYGQAQFTVPNALGYSAASRNGTLVTDSFAYRNGVALTRTADPGAVGVAIPNIALSIGALNLSGAYTFSAYDVGFAAIGAALTPAQELAQFDNVQTWATAIGAQV